MALKLRLETQVAIVTGAGSRAAGIGDGRAAAILFAREGAKVLILDNEPPAAEETLAAIAAEGALKLFARRKGGAEDNWRSKHLANPRGEGLLRPKVGSC